VPEERRGMGVSGMTEEPKRQDKDAQESDENNRWDKIKKFFLELARIGV
jgi:hypothetical protein